VTPRQVGKFPAAVQLLQRIGARRIQQAIMRPVAANIGDDKRFGDQIGDVIGDVALDPIAGNGNRSIQQEIPDENTEMP
jgi:hypothetical protein